MLKKANGAEETARGAERNGKKVPRRERKRRDNE
jgi:hypothetical protein